MKKGKLFFLKKENCHFYFWLSNRDPSLLRKAGVAATEKFKEWRTLSRIRVCDSLEKVDSLQHSKPSNHLGGKGPGGNPIPHYNPPISSPLLSPCPPSRHDCFPPNFSSFRPLFHLTFPRSIQLPHPS